jgi:hypothetical protein
VNPGIDDRLEHLLQLQASRHAAAAASTAVRAGRTIATPWPLPGRSALVILLPWVYPVIGVSGVVDQ